MDERLVGGLWCHQVLEHLDAFVEGRLDPGTLAAARAHVAVCNECAAFGAAYGRLLGALRAKPEEPLDEARLSRLRVSLASAASDAPESS